MAGLNRQYLDENEVACLRLKIEAFRALQLCMIACKLLQIHSQRFHTVSKNLPMRVLVLDDQVQQLWMTLVRTAE